MPSTWRRSDVGHRRGVYSGPAVEAARCVPYAWHFCGQPALKIQLRPVLVHPAVSDGVLACPQCIQVCIAGRREPVAESFWVLSVPPPPSTAAVIGKFVLAAVRLVPVLIPKWEAPIGAEALSIGWNKRSRPYGGHHDT
jgi:hypothetical protein